MEKNMNYSQENVTLAFKNWLQSREFYTGEMGDTNLSDWDGKALAAGAQLTKMVAKAIFKQPVYASTKFSSAKEVEKAEAQLESLRSEFDFVGFKTKWSTPILFLGLFSDSLSILEIQSLFSKVPKQVGSLKRYGYNGGGDASVFGLGGALSTKLLLVYLNSEIYEHHCTDLLSSGTKLNQPINTTFRTCFIDMKGKRLQWSQMGGIVGKNKFLSTLFDGKELFEKNDLLQVLGDIV